MITLIIALFLFMAYCVPGLHVGRSLYAREVREINAKPVTVVPPKPPRPRVKITEMLHTSAPRKCGYLASEGERACNCEHRDEWVQLKNAWLDYEEWQRAYGHIQNGVTSIQQPNVKKALVAVPFWPLFMAADFVKSGADKIVAPGEIERLERQLKELD